MEDQVEIKDHATEFFHDKEAFEIEDTLWWTVGRRSILASFLKRAEREATIRQILEIGCGSGGDLGLLSKYGAVSGVERSPILARRARARNVAKEIYEKDFFELDLSNYFDLFCLFDVLEHIEDDNAFLKRLSEHAGPGDLLLLSVPACQFLYSQHDALLHHYRRYSRIGVEMLLRNNGYKIIMSSYFVFFLFPIVAVSRMNEKLMSMLGRKQTEVKLGRVPAWINTILTGVLKTEAFISRLVRFPIGVWVIALARKC